MNSQKRISEQVIGCTIRVSNILGAGFLEAVYANALAIELRNERIPFEEQKALQVHYHNEAVGVFYADLLVSEKLIVELKALSHLRPEPDAQLMNYLKSGGLSAGLLLNFGTPRVGIKRIVLDYVDAEKI